MRFALRPVISLKCRWSHDLNNILRVKPIESAVSLKNIYTLECTSLAPHIGPEDNLIPTETVSGRSIRLPEQALIPCGIRYPLRLCSWGPTEVHIGEIAFPADHK